MTHRDRAGDPPGRREAAGDAGHRQGFPTPSGGSPARPERRLPKAFGRRPAWLPMSRIAAPRAPSRKPWEAVSMGHYQRSLVSVGSGRGFVAPAERAPVEPHAVHDHGQLASQGDLGALQPPPPRLGDPHGPGLQGRVPGASVSAMALAASWRCLRTMASPHLLMRPLSSSSPELNLRAVSPKGAPAVFDSAKRCGAKRCGNVDSGLESQGGDRPDTGKGHPAAARRVLAHDLQDHAVQAVEFRPHSSARLEHGARSPCANERDRRPARAAAPQSAPGLPCRASNQKP